MLFWIIHASLSGLLMFENTIDFIYSPFIQKFSYTIVFALIVYLKSFLEFLNGKKYHQEIIIVLFLPLQSAYQLSFLLSLPLWLGHLAQRWIVVIVGILIMFRSSQGMLWPLAIWGDCCRLPVKSVYQVKEVHFYFIC